MGTETIQSPFNECTACTPPVKLKNPLMGTETCSHMEHGKSLHNLFC